jgi:diaminopimelate epimerase
LNVRAVKGHGTENDFVLLPDLDGAIDLTAELTRRLCDRRAGIGADGVLRVVRSENDDAARPMAQDAPYFMDYRNADGSIASMCGNGVRVFARYLVDAGLAMPGEWDLATRAGARRVIVAGSGDVSVDMGPPEVFGRSEATLAGTSFAGARVSVGNPHLACAIDTPVTDLDLCDAPGFDAAVFPEGVNVEFFRTVGDHHLEMRVFERGSGETRSCGTGTIAATVAAAIGPDAPDGPRAGGELPQGEWTVDVPGGRLTVTFDGRTSHLSGPAVLVAEGETYPGWL